MTDTSGLSPVTIERATEQLRQERETFDQMKRHESRWFFLRLVMGYISVILLSAVIAISSSVLFNVASFPESVVTLAAAALFVDVLGLLVAVWKVVLNPEFQAKLVPVTTVALTSIDPAQSSEE